MIKLIATDIDGTLLKLDFTFNHAVIDCIKKLRQQGVKISLVTGRMHQCTNFIADELGLSDMPVVSYQGGLVVQGGKVLYEKNLNPQYAREIINWAKAKNIHVNLYMNDELYVEHDDEAIRRYTDERKCNFHVVNFDDVKLDRVNKMLLIDFQNAQAVTEYQKYLASKYEDLHIVKSTPYFCEICNQEATKKDAVEFLKKYWNLKDDEVLTIGDQNNDISLLQAGGISVAMGNGTEELKAVADYVTDTVDNDGFVKAVERFIYNESKV